MCRIIGDPHKCIICPYVGPSYTLLSHNLVNSSCLLLRPSTFSSTSPMIQRSWWKVSLLLIRVGQTLEDLEVLTTPMTPVALVLIFSLLSVILVHLYLTNQIQRHWLIDQPRPPSKV